MGTQISNVARCLIAEYNEAMKGSGWEVPVNSSIQQERGGSLEIAEERSSQDKHEVFHRCVGGNIAEVADDGGVPEQTWATRLMQKLPAPSCKPQVVKASQRTEQRRKVIEPVGKQLPTQAENKLGQSQTQGKDCDTAARRRSIDRQRVERIPRNRIEMQGPGSRFSAKSGPAVWPALRSGEIEFMLDKPMSFSPTRRICSPSLAVGNFRFKILVFPRGTAKDAGRHLGAFVLADPGDVQPDSTFKNVKYDITLVNWANFSQSKFKSDIFSFKASGVEIDRGWHDMVSVDSIAKSGSEWVGPNGAVCIRARCQVPAYQVWTRDQLRHT